MKKEIFNDLIGLAIMFVLALAAVAVRMIIWL